MDVRNAPFILVLSAFIWSIHVEEAESSRLLTLMGLGMVARMFMPKVVVLPMQGGGGTGGLLGRQIGGGEPMNFQAQFQRGLRQLTLSRTSLAPGTTNGQITNTAQMVVNGQQTEGDLTVTRNNGEGPGMSITGQMTSGAPAAPNGFQNVQQPRQNLRSPRENTMSNGQMIQTTPQMTSNPQVTSNQQMTSNGQPMKNSQLTQQGQRVQAMQFQQNDQTAVQSVHYRQNAKNRQNMQMRQKGQGFQNLQSRQAVATGVRQNAEANTPRSVVRAEYRYRNRQQPMNSRPSFNRQPKMMSGMNLAKQNARSFRSQTQSPDVSSSTPVPSTSENPSTTSGFIPSTPPFSSTLEPPTTSDIPTTDTTLEVPEEESVSPSSAPKVWSQRIPNLADEERSSLITTPGAIFRNFANLASNSDISSWGSSSPFSQRSVLTLNQPVAHTAMELLDRAREVATSALLGDDTTTDLFDNTVIITPSSLSNSPGGLDSILEAAGRALRSNPALLLNLGSLGSHSPPTTGILKLNELPKTTLEPLNKQER